MKRLIIVCAGNTHPNDNQITVYPDTQITNSIHDPAQSWNVITVGAYTELNTLKDTALTRYSPLAPSIFYNISYLG